MKENNTAPSKKQDEVMSLDCICMVWICRPKIYFSLFGSFLCVYIYSSKCRQKVPFLLKHEGMYELTMFKIKQKVQIFLSC